MRNRWRVYSVAFTLSLVIAAVMVVLRLVFDVNAEWMNFVTTLILAGATVTYVVLTFNILRSSQKQADAAIRMAELESRPIVIQKAIHQGIDSEATQLDYITKIDEDPHYFYHFLVINAGKGPAIEINVSILNENKNCILSWERAFLRSGEEEVFPFGKARDKRQSMSDLEEGIHYHLVCEYKDTLNYYHQTWMPFKISKAERGNQLYVISDKLELKTNISEEDRLIYLDVKERNND